VVEEIGEKFEGMRVNWPRRYTGNLLYGQMGLLPLAWLLLLLRELRDPGP
jgi:hypothetical protein